MMKRILFLMALLVVGVAHGQQGVIHGSGDPRLRTPTDLCPAPIYQDDATGTRYLAASERPCVWTLPGGGLSVPVSIGVPTAPNLLQIQDPNNGTGSQSNIYAAIQPQNYYTLRSLYNGIANMNTGTNNTPSQVRAIMEGDSTALFHNIFAVCTLAAQFGYVGFDYGGIGGPQLLYGQPCPVSSQTNNGSSGTITINNGAGSIVPGTGAPYDFTRSPNGVITNLANGASITFGQAGVYGYGNVLKVYWIKEPTDGIFGATPGTITITATSPSGGTCFTPCTLFTGSAFNATKVGVVTTVFKPLDQYTITIAATGGAVDIKATGIYDNTHSGVIIEGGDGRAGLQLSDTTTTPAAITNPWFASAAGNPIPITAWSVTSNVITITGANNLVAGQRVVLGGFNTTTALNSVSGIVSGTGLSASGFQMPITFANSSGTENAWALPSDSNAIAFYEGEGNGQVGGTGCQQSTTAAPTTWKDYGYWINLYVQQWQVGNPLMDFEFTSAYPKTNVGAGACLPTLNEQMRQYAQAHQMVYYDDWFPSSSIQMLNVGQSGDGVHSSQSEQLAASVNLVNQMGIQSFLGAVGSPVANTTSESVNFWLAQSPNPLTASKGLCNPTTVCYSAAALASAHLYTDGTYDTWLDVSNIFAIWDYTHTTPLFCMQTTNTASMPAACKVALGAAGAMTFTGTNPPQVSISSSTAGTELDITSSLANSGGQAALQLTGGANSAITGILYKVGASFLWRTGVQGSNDFLIKDDTGGKIVLDFPNNTMPANSIGGNSKGATLLTIQTATNCAVNSVSPAACAAAASGAVVVPTTTTTYTVNTTAVQANSRILLFPMSFAGNLPSAPTCVAPAVTSTPTISAIVAATSFTFALPSTTGQTCWQYVIVN